MKTILSTILFFLVTSLAAQESDIAFADNKKVEFGLPVQQLSTSRKMAGQKGFSGLNIAGLLAEGKASKNILGYSKKQTPIEAWFFPGNSTRNALIIGGVHGSELSAIEVANELIDLLQSGVKPHYNVIIVPTLFPDNAEAAAASKEDRHQTNCGRYTGKDAVDPNRQMPRLGQAFQMTKPQDAYGREIEKENTLLLQLIQDYVPQRIVNLHGIKTYTKAGVYADPRADCNGRALGFESDSTLAILMANHIGGKGGNVPGNDLKNNPSALYYLDPKPAPAGQIQPRNLWGANSSGRIAGVSLGSWGSTAVCDAGSGYNRPAMRIITMEFPGYKKPAEYLSDVDRKWFRQQVGLYAEAIHQYFLQEYCLEDEGPQKQSTASTASGK